MKHTLLTLVLLAPAAAAQDWTNLGGNRARNGFVYPLGPESATPLWTNSADFSLISWHPFVHAGRVFTVRESGFPQNGGAANDALVAYDLDTGVEQWRTTLPFGGNTATEWIAWIAGANGGRVYASRGSNGQPQPIRAFDAASGAPLWTSALSTQAFAYDGVVFAPDGDLLIGDFGQVARIDSVDGHTVWSKPRVRAVSGNCGPAASASAVYIDKVVPGGSVISKLDIATGNTLYDSSLMSGFTEQNAPFLSHDGKTVYFSRTQNNPAVDFLYAFRDTGTSFSFLWSRPVRWTTSHEHGIGPDGSLYTFLPTDEFVRLDPDTGAVTASAGVLSPLGSPNLSPETAVDARRTVYVSNGWASSPANLGRMWAFNASLTQLHFTLNLERQNQGGPALAEDGTLVMCDLNAVRAWRQSGVPQTYCTSQGNSLGCTPPIYTLGLPSATAGPGFAVLSSLAVTNTNGILFYSKTGPASVPFMGGFLCVAPPTVRTPLQNSGGGGPCDGFFALDFNVWIATGLDPGLVAGAPVWAQYWSRDPASASATNLTNAVQFVIGP